MNWERRYSILAALFGGYFLSYMDRMVMASAIPFVADEYQLSPLAMGGVLSAFFIGYAVMQLPGGLLVDRLGAGRVLVMSIIAWSTFTTLTGLAESFIALVVIRVLFGLSEGPFPPAAAKTVTLWFPPGEIGRANGAQLAAIKIGAAVAPLLVAPLILHWGWRSVFYSLLIPGLILAFWVRSLVKEAPVALEAHPAAPLADGVAPQLWQVLRVPGILWLATALFFVNLASWGLSNWLPTYLLRARGFSIAEMGMGASLPFLAGALGYYVSGHVSDRYFSARRHVPIIAGLIAGAVMTYGAAVAPNGQWAVAFLALAFLFLFVASGGLFTLPLLMAPKETVGVAFGLINTVAQVAAFLSPLLVGAILKATHSNFTLVFYGFVGLYLIGAAAALCLRKPVLVRITASI